MKLFIASDIHGSAYYCQRLISAFEAEKADKMLLLGDILYHGPRNALPNEYSPQEVVGLLKPFSDRITAVRGNCDADVDLMVLGIDMPYVRYFKLDGVDCAAYHGHRDAPNVPAGGVIISGHTHVPVLAHCGGIYMINPGSVSIPKQGSPHGYIVYENRTFVHRDLDGKECARISI